MKRRLLVLALLVASFVHGAPRQYRLEELLPVAKVHGLSFSPDGSQILISSDSGTRYNLRSVSTRTGKVSPVMTLSDGSAYNASFFPNDNRILYHQDFKGQKALWVLELDGRAHPLVRDARIVEFLGWAADQRAMYVVTTVPLTIQRIELDSYKSTTLFGGDFFRPLLKRISPDGQWLASDTDPLIPGNDVKLIRVPTRENQSLAVQVSGARYQVGTFDPTSRWFYYLTDQGEDFLRVRSYGLDTGKHEDVERADSDIVGTSFSPSGRYRTSIIDQEGRHVLKLYDTAAGEHVPVPDLPKGNITALEISRGDRFIACLLDTDRSPASLYYWEIGTAKPKRLTELRKRFNPNHLVESEPVRFNSFDGLAIPCLLYKPHQATSKRKAPALIWLHGGPASQTRVRYAPHLQYLVNRGFVVLAVNCRGSTGYGWRFSAADDRKHGREPLQDCLEARKYLASLPFVAADRIGIMGESYGGYMVLAALAFHPGTFKVGVDLFGVSNWQRWVDDLASRSPLGPAREPWVREIGHPVKDQEKLKAISPVFHAEKIREPLFILQGARDPKIPKAETDKVVQTVTTNHVPIEYLVVDEEHGFAKTENYLNAWRRIVRFLENHL